MGAAHRHIPPWFTPSARARPWLQSPSAQRFGPWPSRHRARRGGRLGVGDHNRQEAHGSGVAGGAPGPGQRHSARRSPPGGSPRGGWAASVGIPRDQDRTAAADEAAPVELWQAVLIEGEARCVEAEIAEVRGRPAAARTCATSRRLIPPSPPRKADTPPSRSAARPAHAGCRSKSSARIRPRLLTRQAQSAGDGVAGIEGRNLHAEPGHRLGDLHTHGTEAEDRERAGQVRDLEQRPSSAGGRLTPSAASGRWARPRGDHGGGEAKRAPSPIHVRPSTNGPAR